MRLQRAAAVAVAGYSIETPRLLLHSASPRFPNGIGNQNDQVGRYLMVQGAPQVAGRFPELLGMYKGPPPEICSEQFYETDAARGFARGFAIQTVGPQPIAWAEHVLADGHWGQALREYMRDYNHWFTLGTLCELLPLPENRVTLAEEKDARGIPVARMDYTQCDNDRANIAYAKATLHRIWEAAGAQDVLTIDRYAHLVGGCRMGRSPHDSVVDADHRVWGLPNLFVADGSVMPTQGSANPALTIMALASRLAGAPRRASRSRGGALMRMPAPRSARPEVVAVTGASAGVGRAIAHAFARRGAHVALLARDARRPRRGRGQRSRQLGGRALALPVDVADARGRRRGGERASRSSSARSTSGSTTRWRRSSRRVHATRASEFERATTRDLSRHRPRHDGRARAHAPRDRGTIVQVGSALAYRAIPLQAAYCGAKFAIRGFTDSVRTELLHERSRVWITMVQLPAVNTPQFEWCLTRMPHHPQPVPPIFQPEVPAEARLLGGPPSPARALGRPQHGQGDPRELPRAVARRPLPRPHRLRLPADGRSCRCPRTARPTSSARSRGSAATHGRFDDRATSRSPQLWLAEHRGALLAGAASALAAAAARSGADEPPRAG